ncbi:MAG: DsrE family protein [Enterobacter hormaechei]
MKRVAFVFTSARIASASGREGWMHYRDLALTEDIGVFFWAMASSSSGRPTTAGYSCARLHCDRTSSLYDIETFYVCADSLAARGLNEKTPFVLDVTILTSAALREQLSHYDTVLTF